MCHTVAIQMRLGAKIPMGVTFYDMANKTPPAPRQNFFELAPSLQVKIRIPEVGAK